MNVLATRFLLTSGHVVATCLALHALPLAGVEVRTLHIVSSWL